MQARDGALKATVAHLDAAGAMVIHACGHRDRIRGSGAADPDKYEPSATCETLDHSIMYAFAVELKDGVFHHPDSYSPERGARLSTVRPR